jgi:hypothetical protein
MLQSSKVASLNRNLAGASVCSFMSDRVGLGRIRRFWGATGTSSDISVGAIAVSKSVAGVGVGVGAGAGEGEGAEAGVGAGVEAGIESATSVFFLRFVFFTPSVRRNGFGPPRRQILSSSVRLNGTIRLPFFCHTCMAF